MAALLVLGVLGLFGILGISSGDDMPEDEGDMTPDEPMTLTGVEGQDDILNGGDANDTITGNADEPDMLNGQGGDDLLIVRDGNTATGGEGRDIFDVSEGDKGTITDFNPDEDILQVLFLQDPIAAQTPPVLRWEATDAGVELHAIQDESDTVTEATRLVTLLGLTEAPTEAAVEVVWHNTVPNPSDTQLLNPFTQAG